MCGVVFALQHDGELDVEACKAGLSSLHHRGPDGSNFWANECAFVGHARLCIMDLTEAGTQPFHLGSKIATINGEFYDYAFLRSIVLADGRELRSECDSELLLHLYEMFGLQCVRLLNGEWTFVIYDSVTHEVVAARDRFGTKPLFRYQTAGKCIFASEVKAIAVVHGSLSLSDRYCFALDPTRDGTVFHGVFHVPPGCAMVSRDGIEFETVDTLGYQFSAVSRCITNGTEAAEALLGALDRSVQRRLVSDVPVGCFLSGGVDSSIVLGLMLRHVRHVHCFSVVFPGDEMNDESDYIESVIEFHRARGAQITAHTVSVSGQASGTPYSDSAFVTESELLDDVCYHLMALSKKARDVGVPVVLCGQGADELLAGYNWLVHDLVHDSQTPGFVETAIKYDQPRDELRAFMATHPARVAGPLDAGLWLQQKAMHKDVLNIRADRVEMHNSIEGRLPFLDSEVVQTVASFATSLLVDQAGELPREKWVLYKAAQDLAPALVLSRTKHMFRQVRAQPPNSLELAYLQSLARDCVDVLPGLHPEDLAVLDLADKNQLADRNDFVRVRNLLSLCKAFRLSSVSKSGVSDWNQVQPKHLELWRDCHDRGFEEALLQLEQVQRDPPKCERTGVEIRGQPNASVSDVIQSPLRLIHNSDVCIIHHGIQNTTQALQIANQFGSELKESVVIAACREGKWLRVAS